MEITLEQLDRFTFDMIAEIRKAAPDADENTVMRITKGIFDLMEKYMFIDFINEN